MVQDEDQLKRPATHTPSRTPPSRESSPDLRKTRRRSESVPSDASEAGRYISRSPSRSRSGSVSEDGEEGDRRTRYISRSPSISPDRILQAMGEERLEGDV